MRITFTPRSYQQAALTHLLTTPRCALWAGMGMGKTVTTLTAIDVLRIADIGPALVLAPLRVARSVWPEEAAKWNHLANLRVVPIVGSVTERKRALAIPADIHVMNYENLEWLVETLKSRWPYKIVVADESTRLKGFRTRQGTKRAKYLAKMCWQSDRFIELTGTPAPNGLTDLWGQAWFLDRGERLGSNYTDFHQRWFRNVSHGPFPVMEPMPYAQAEIQNRLRDLCLTLDPRDHFNLQDPIHIVVKIDLPQEAQKAYRELERTMFTSIANESIEVLSIAAKTMKCLQMANGAVYIDPNATRWVESHDMKLAALSEIIADAAGAPVLVAYQFQSDLSRLKKVFPTARVLDKNAATIRDWNAGRISILLAHPASASHGLNLQDGGNILVFFGHWWDLEQRQQIIERIGPVRQAQSGHERPVYIYDLVARGTIDEIVLRRHQTKMDVQDLLLAAMKDEIAC